MSYIPVMIQRRDPDTELWSDAFKAHALKVNRAGGGEAYAAGREQFQARLTFELRWHKAVEAMRWEPQSYRLIYSGQTLNIVDYDDFMEEHRIVKLTGVVYNG